MSKKLEFEKLNKKLNKVMEEHCINTDEAAKKTMDLLKEHCKTYGELMEKIKRLKANARWDGKAGERNLMDRCEELVKEEMNDLKTIIHS